MPGTIIDMHMHTTKGASDSMLNPDDLSAEATRVGVGRRRRGRHRAGGLGRPDGILFRGVATAERGHQHETSKRADHAHRLLQGARS